MYVNLVAAMAENRGIGLNNRLPWHLPADLRHFQALTTGKVLVMGRNTWDSLGKPLPRRHSIVLSQATGRPAGPDVTWARSWHEALAVATARGVQEIFVIGGARIYEQSLTFAHRIYLTLVHTTVAADAWFPELVTTEWQETERVSHAADERNAYPYTFTVWQRNALSRETSDQSG